MYLPTNPAIQAAQDMHRTWADITTDQKAALKSEITNDPTGQGYAGKAADLQFELLCTAYTADVNKPGVPQVQRFGLVASSALWDQIVNTPTLSGNSLSSELGIDAQTAGNPLQRLALDIKSTLADLPEIDFSDPSVYEKIAGFAGAVVQAGLIAQATANAFLLDTRHQCRAVEMFGLIPSWPEFQAALI